MNRPSTSRLVCGGSVGLVLVLAASACGLPLSGHTPAVPRSRTNPGAMPVAMLERVDLGGAEQSVLVRGADRSRPIVLFLHGGPGMPSMFLAHAFQRELEQDFVVVHWDRRGAGKSYDARFPVESLTTRRTLDDLYALRTWLRRTIGDNPVILVGHSWGSYLGFLAIHEHPEQFDAYVATGVLTPDTSAAHADQRTCVATAARAEGDTVLARRLEAPLSDSTPRVSEDMEFRVGGELVGARGPWPIIRTGFTAPEYTILDAMHVRSGAQFVAAHMRYTVDDSWMQQNPVFRIPVFFALGRYDCNTPATAAMRFFATIQAPTKAVMWFDSSAHFPFWEQPDRFRTLLRGVDSISRRRIANAGSSF